MMNAYTIKKVLPRLLIATVGINLSYYLVIIAIDITNILGDGVAGLLTAPFERIGMTWDPGALSAMILSVVAIIGAFKLFSRVFKRTGRAADQTGGIGYFLLSIILPVALVILAIFAVLTIRLGLMVGLALVSPVAMAAMILPSTEGLFKKWWSLFTTTLVIYPIVMVMIALGKVMTYIFGNIDGGTVTASLSGVFAVVAQFVPLAMIPFAFKLAGGVIGSVGNFINGKAVGGVKSWVQGDARDPNSRISRAKEKRDNADLNRRLAGNARAANLTNNANSRLGKWAGSKLQRSVAGYDVLAAQSAQNKRVGEEMSDTIATGDDSQIRALSARRIKQQDGSYKWISAGGKVMKESDVIAAKQRWGNNTSAYQRALTYEMSKASTAEEATMIAQAYDGTDGGPALKNEWNLDDREAKGLWTGAAYANQNKRLEWKHMTWDASANGGTGGMVFDSAGMADEIYNNRGSYQMSQMGSTTINALRQEHKDATAAMSRAATPMEQRQAAERIHKIESIASTMSQELRARGDIPEGPDGELIPTGSGAGAVNDEIAAFVNETQAYAGTQGRTLKPESRNLMDADRSMTGPTDAARAPANAANEPRNPDGSFRDRPTVDGGRASNTRADQGTPHRANPKDMG